MLIHSSESSTLSQYSVLLAVLLLQMRLEMFTHLLKHSIIAISLTSAYESGFSVHAHLTWFCQ